MKGLIGKKVGMTQVYDEQGRIVPVTVIEAGPCVVVDVKTLERDGYCAAQLGFGSRKAKNVSKAVAGHCAKAGLKETMPSVLREFRLAGAGERAPDLLDSLEKAGCDIQTALRETYMGDRSFYRRMLAKLPASAAFSQVCADFGAKDAAALYESSHKLKGLYASLGLSPLYAVCSEIVEIARAGGLDGVEELLARLGKLHGEIAETIRKDAK